MDNDKPIYHDYNGETLIGEIKETSISRERGIGITVQFRPMTLEEEKQCQLYRENVVREVISTHEELPDILKRRINEELTKRLKNER